MYKKSIKLFIISCLILLLCGCSVVRIDTKNIDSMVNVILKKNNTLYNQVGQGYKYYLPSGVTYINSDDFNDILYCDGVYYYLYINTIDYYYNSKVDYNEDNSLYYSRKLNKVDGFTNNGYLQIKETNNKYKLTFMYNYAKIEALVPKDKLNKTVLNSTYILSTIKYNKDIIELILNEDYFTNKTGKFNDYKSKEQSTNFELKKETKEG